MSIIPWLVAARRYTITPWADHCAWNWLTPATTCSPGTTSGARSFFDDADRERFVALFGLMAECFGKEAIIDI